jgi:hypothetical protein
MSLQIEVQLKAGKFPGQATQSEKPAIGGFFCHKKSTHSRYCGNSFFIFGAAYAQE